MKEILTIIYECHIINVSSMKKKNYYTVILRSDSDEESFEDSSLRSE